MAAIAFDFEKNAFLSLIDRLFVEAFEIIEIADVVHCRR